MADIIGNKNQLLGMHGTVDCDKCVEALVYKAELDTVNIDEINKASETGSLYVIADGRICKTCNKSDETLAKYKLVPTGLTQRFSLYPLFASFIKINGMWEGAYIGTGTQLFEMYKKHYNPTNKFICEYKDIFGGDNRNLDIKGNGLDEVLQNNKRILTEQEQEIKAVIEEVNEYESNVNSMEQAIEKLLKQADTKKSKSAKSKKALCKANRLKAHLDKMKQKEERKEKIKETTEKQEKQKTVVKGIADDTIEWLDITPLEESTYTFKDLATIELEAKIVNFVNDDTDFVTAKLLNDEIKPLVAEENTEEIDVKQENKNELSADKNEEQLIESMDHDCIIQNQEAFYYEQQLKKDLIQDIYERLMVKENWMQRTNRNRLGFYLKGIFIVVKFSMKMNGNAIRGNGYIYSEDRTKCVVNTGLWDVYGNNIYLIDHTPYTLDFYNKKLSIMVNKAALLAMGFSIENVKYLPEPIKFVTDRSQLIFDADISDFDFNDDMHLNHIIEHRRFRFPCKYSKTPARVLSDKVKDAIVQAIKIQKTDYKYIIPKYDFKRQTIQFMVPFHLDTNLNQKPELYIIIGKENGIWQVYTVLYPDDAYDDARMLSKPSNNWLD